MDNRQDTIAGWVLHYVNVPSMESTCAKVALPGQVIENLSIKPYSVSMYHECIKRLIEA